MALESNCSGFSCDLLPRHRRGETRGKNTDASTNHSINRSINQSINQSINHSINRLINQSICQSINLRGRKQTIRPSTCIKNPLGALGGKKYKQRKCDFSIGDTKQSRPLGYRGKGVAALQLKDHARHERSTAMISLPLHARSRRLISSHLWRFTLEVDG